MTSERKQFNDFPRLKGERIEISNDCFENKPVII